MTHDDLVIHETVHAPAETVFAFLTDPDRYARWMGSVATIDARPGGEYRTSMRDGLAAAGEFVRVEPSRRVVFTWGWEGDDVVPPGSTTVEIDLEEHDGVTTVTLTHRGLPGPEQVEHHLAGWRLYLGRLAVTATGGDPGPDPNTAEPATGGP